MRTFPLLFILVWWSLSGCSSTPRVDHQVEQLKAALWEVPVGMPRPAFEALLARHGIGPERFGPGIGNSWTEVRSYAVTKDLGVLVVYGRQDGDPELEWIISEFALGSLLRSKSGLVTNFFPTE